MKMATQHLILMMSNENIHPTLDLVLKVRWYELIESGEKREEYRKIGDYWSKRLIAFPDARKCVGGVPMPSQGDVLNNTGTAFRKFAFVRFHRAYTSTTMTFVLDGTEIGEGNPEWGAIPGQKYFVIKLGNRIE